MLYTPSIFYIHHCTIPDSTGSYTILAVLVNFQLNPLSANPAKWSNTLK